jgi:hypothetical protein
LTAEPNHRVVERIVADVQREILDGRGVSARKVGGLVTNNFSFTFSLSFETESEPYDFFVKIPKKDLRGVAPTIFPLSDADRRLGSEEAASLRLLGDAWHGDDLDVRWIRLVGTLPPYNAMVTERIFAPEAVGIYRRWDLRRRLGFRRDARRLRDAMSRFGTALGRFHRTQSTPLTFEPSPAIAKLESYAGELQAMTGSALPVRVVSTLASVHGGEIEGIGAPTLKGIDIRNFLTDGQERIYLLDPGRTKMTFREADLARFILTYRILHWGSRILPVAGAPDPRAERAFLDSYYAGEQPTPGLLEFFVVKEQLKHWHTALDSLERRRWSISLKRQIARFYVNPFYKRQLDSSHRALVLLKRGSAQTANTATE